MVSGNEFSTFGLRLLSQTDSYYLLKDPEARVANYTPHNQTNKKRMKRKCRPFFFLPVSEDRHHVCLLYVCET